jgi:hypothetical protein
VGAVLRQGLLFLWILGSLTCGVLCPPARAETPSTTFSETSIAALTQGLVAQSFPELQSKSIAHHTFDAADVFFESNLEVASLMPWHQGPVQYLVNYNPAVFRKGCPPAAIEGILAHELSHTLDYVNGGIPALLEIVNALRLPQSNQRYEHQTDLQAIFRGYGPGLIAYREWIYTQLTPGAIRQKQATYYTPDEIRLLMESLVWAKAHDLEAPWKHWLLQNVPTSRKSLLNALQGLKSGMVKRL